MPATGGSITVRWNEGVSALVTISSNGSASTGFTVNGNAVTFPYRLTATTKFDVIENGDYTVSVLFQGSEIANTPDGTRLVVLRNGGQLVFAPSVDATRPLGTPGLPTYANSRVGPFDPMRNVYNWKSSNTRKLRAALGRARAGAGNFNVMFHGDSHTEGKVDGSTFNRAKCFSLAFRDTLSALGTPVSGDGMVMAGNGANSTPIDPRIGTTGTWVHTAGYAHSSTNGATLTITFTNPCTSIDIWSSGNSGAFEVRLDGVLQTTVNPNGQNAWVKTTITGSSGVHAVQITKTNTTLTAIRCMNAYSSTGLLVHNVGIAGWSANNFITFTAWNQGAGSIEQVLPKANLDLAVFNIGVNDFVLQGRTAAQAAADFATLVARWQPGPDVILTVEPHTSSIIQSDWETFASLVYDLADTLDVPLLDIYGRIGTYTQGNANGLYGDTAHLTTQGHADWGRCLALTVAS